MKTLIEKYSNKANWKEIYYNELIRHRRFLDLYNDLQQLSNEEKIKQENNLVWVVNNKSNEEKIKAIMTEIWNKLSDNSYWTVILDLSIHDIEKIIHKHLTKNIEEKENAETFYLGSE